MARGRPGAVDGRLEGCSDRDGGGRGGRGGSVGRARSWRWDLELTDALEGRRELEGTPGWVIMAILSGRHYQKYTTGDLFSLLPHPNCVARNTQPLAPFLACIGGPVARSRKISSENKFSVLLLHEACSIPLPLPSAGTAPATLDQSVWRSIVMI